MIGVVGLLDSNIIVDILRGYLPAQNWAVANRGQIYALSSITRMEVVLGTSNKTELQRVLAIVNTYPIVYPNEEDSKWAQQQFEAFHLSHRIEAPDCFLAATSVRLSLPVYTRNLKDFNVLPSVVVHVPYS